VKTLEVAAADIAARPSSPRDLALDLGAVAPAPAAEPQVARWPGAVRLLILVGGAAGLWIGLGWIALRVLKLG
jgi:hypothetical protein